MISLPICSSCRHFRPERVDGNYCDAFPDGPGIPMEILRNEFDHRKPFPGDNGILYAPRPGTEPPPIVSGRKMIRGMMRSLGLLEDEKP